MTVTPSEFGHSMLFCKKKTRVMWEYCI